MRRPVTPGWTVLEFVVEPSAEEAIGVYAAEVSDGRVRVDPSEHSEYGWFSFEECLERVHYRGLKDGLRSVHEYVTGTKQPAKELCLWSE